jgi:hypothetical protein
MNARLLNVGALHFFNLLGNRHPQVYALPINLQVFSKFRIIE